MALFSGTKSQARRPAQEGDEKENYDGIAQKTDTPPRQALQDFQNKVFGTPAVNGPDFNTRDISTSSKRPEQNSRPSFDHTGQVTENESRRKDFGIYQFDHDQQDYLDPRSSGDSGYSSVGANSRVSSRSTSTKHNRQERDRSPISTKAGVGQDESTPSLIVLNGLKVNKRGLILDEEGDPIGELYEGDIIDCVRQKADACGNVLDEYGRVVGRVRALLVGPPSPMLRPPTPRLSNTEHSMRDSPVPLIPARSPTTLSDQFAEDEGHFPRRQVQTVGQKLVFKGDPLFPTTAQPTTHQQDAGHQDEGLIIRETSTCDCSAQPTKSRQIGHDNNLQKPPSHLLPVAASSMRRSESPSFDLEPDSTAEIVASYEGLPTSEKSTTTALLNDQRAVEETIAEWDQTLTARKQRERLQPVAAPQNMTADDDVSSNTGAIVSIRQKQATSTDRKSEAPRSSPNPSLKRSKSESMLHVADRPPVSAVPAVPAIPRNLSDIQKPTFANGNAFLATAPGQPGGSNLTPNVKRPPPLSLPRRGSFGDLPRSSSLANAPPRPGIPARQLTAPDFSKSMQLGIAALEAQSPILRPRTPGSTPLVSSPLSSHGKTSLSL